MQRFARTLLGDLDAVRNGVTEPRSNGQTDGQTSRLKTLKRTMYEERASICCAPACCHAKPAESTESEEGPLRGRLTSVFY
jgi:hypothetical protein